MPCSVGLSTKHMVFCSNSCAYCGALVVQVVIKGAEPFGGSYVAPVAIVHFASQLSCVYRVTKYFNQWEFLPLERVVIDERRVKQAYTTKRKAMRRGFFRVIKQLALIGERKVTMRMKIRVGH